MNLLMTEEVSLKNATPILIDLTLPRKLTVCKEQNKIRLPTGLSIKIIIVELVMQ